MSGPRRVAALSGVVLAALVLVVWATGREAPGPGAPDRVRAVVMPYLTFMPFHIAAEEGYFEAQDLEVEFVLLPRIQELMTGLARGDVDVAGGMATTTVFNSIAGGARMRLIGALGHLPSDCAFSGAVARRELIEDGSLEDPGRLRELTWDADLLIPYGFWLHRLLRPYGLDVDDLSLVNLPEATAVEALVNDTVDVALATEPFLGALADRPDDAVLWQDFGDIVPGYQISNIMYGPSLLDERSDVGERFAIAMLRAIRQYRQGKTPRNMAIVEAATGLTSDQVREACWPDARPDGRIPTGAFRDYQRWMLDRDLVERLLEEDEFVDRRFIQHANEALAGRREP